MPVRSVKESVICPLNSFKGSYRRFFVRLKKFINLLTRLIGSHSRRISLNPFKYHIVPSYVGDNTGSSVLLTFKIIFISTLLSKGAKVKYGSA